MTSSPHTVIEPELFLWSPWQEDCLSCMPVMTEYDPSFLALRDLIKEIEDRQVPDDIRIKIKNIAGLIEARDIFCNEKTSKPSEAVETLVKATHDLPCDQLLKDGNTKVLMHHEMLSGNIAGHILKFFVSAAKAKSVLEIGTFTGFSALMMAEALPHDGHVTTCDFDPYISQVARGLVDKSLHGYKINIITGLAKDTLLDLAEKKQKFDFVFIDANKDQYVDYLNICLDSLLAPGGTIVADNALLYGTTYDKTLTHNQKLGPYIRQFDEAVAARTDIYHVLVPVRDGMMIIRRKEDTDGSIKTT